MLRSYRAVAYHLLSVLIPFIVLRFGGNGALDKAICSLHNQEVPYLWAARPVLETTEIAKVSTKKSYCVATVSVSAHMPWSTPV